MVTTVGSHGNLGQVHNLKIKALNIMMCRMANVYAEVA